MIEKGLIPLTLGSIFRQCHHGIRFDQNYLPKGNTIAYFVTTILSLNFFMFIVKLDVSRTNTPAYFCTLTPKLALIHSPFITILDLLNTNTSLFCITINDENTALGIFIFCSLQYYICQKQTL
jgi:hypothetical protein